jgi:hypothetical protein
MDGQYFLFFYLVHCYIIIRIWLNDAGRNKSEKVRLNQIQSASVLVHVGTFRQSERIHPRESIRKVQILDFGVVSVLLNPSTD